MGTTQFEYLGCGGGEGESGRWSSRRKKKGEGVRLNVDVEGWDVGWNMR